MNADDISIGLSLCAFLISVVSVFFSFKQFRIRLKQVKADNYFRIIEINRNLITIALGDDDFLTALDGREAFPSAKVARYFQLWINQMEYIWSLNENDLLSKGNWLSLLEDMRDFKSIPAFQSHWVHVKRYYDRNFVIFFEES